MTATRGMWSKRTARVLAVIILGFYGLDVLMLGGSSAWTLGFRLLWALSLLGYSAFSSELPEPWARWIEDLHVGVIACSVVGLVGMTGGTQSPYFVLVPVLPLANCLMYRRSARAACWAERWAPWGPSCSGGCRSTTCSRRSFA